MQAREEMEFASESKDTTYFDEEAAAAKEAVDGTFSGCVLTFSSTCAFVSFSLKCLLAQCPCKYAGVSLILIVIV